MRFQDKVVIVSGGGSVGPSMSNGLDSAIQFAREGAKAVVVARRLDSAKETVQMIKDEGGEAIAVEANVLRAPDVQRMVETTLATYARIDVLFNNVGAGWGTDIVNTPEEHWDMTFDVCVKSVFLVSKHVIPEMRKAGSGVIVNNASIAGMFYD